MARIRTVKPEFFRHYGLYTAEIEEKLPLRIAFAGLWTAADREGRFRWRPQELKLDCLPHDKLDFSRVLDALMTRGFIGKYVVNGQVYGWIPGFLTHQVINNRERPSDLPTPTESNSAQQNGGLSDSTFLAELTLNSINPANITESNSATREARDTEMHVHAQGEGKGKEHGREHGMTRSRRVNHETPAPENFPITDTLKEWASKHVPGLDLETQTEQFLDHHRSKGDRFTDWPASWRKWMRNAAEWGQARNNGRRGPATNAKTELPYDEWDEEIKAKSAKGNI